MNNDDDDDDDDHNNIEIIIIIIIKPAQQGNLILGSDFSLLDNKMLTNIS